MLKVTEVLKSQGELRPRHTVPGLTSQDVPETVSGKNMRIIGREAQFVTATQIFNGRAKLPGYVALSTFKIYLQNREKGLYFSLPLALLLCIMAKDASCSSLMSKPFGLDTPLQ